MLTDWTQFLLHLHHTSTSSEDGVFHSKYSLLFCLWKTQQHLKLLTPIDNLHYTIFSFKNGHCFSLKSQIHNEGLEFFLWRISKWLRVTTVLLLLQRTSHWCTNITKSRVTYQTVFQTQCDQCYLQCSMLTTTRYHHHKTYWYIHTCTLDKMNEYNYFLMVHVTES